MLQAIRARWTTALALLIAVATAWMFAASRPTSPPPGAETEIVCAPEVPVTPGISKQQGQEDPGTPRGAAMAADRPSGIPFAQVLLHETSPPGVVHGRPRSTPTGTGYPRGPPA